MRSSEDLVNYIIPHSFKDHFFQIFFYFESLVHLLTTGTTKTNEILKKNGYEKRSIQKNVAKLEVVCLRVYHWTEMKYISLCKNLEGKENTKHKDFTIKVDTRQTEHLANNTFKCKKNAFKIKGNKKTSDRK